MFSVKPMYQMRPNVAMIEVGMAIAGDRASSGSSTGRAARRARRESSPRQMLFDVVDRRLDEGREIADDAACSPGRRRETRSRRLTDLLDDFDRVGARTGAGR
jgi:hypothetical protein